MFIIQGLDNFAVRERVAQGSYPLMMSLIHYQQVTQLKFYYRSQLNNFTTDNN